MFFKFKVGCGRNIKNEYKSLIDKIKIEALDGTLSEVLLHPVVSWHIKNEFPFHFRERRQVL